MRFAFLVFFVDPANPGARVSPSDLQTVRMVLASVPGLSRALVYTPEAASDVYNDDGASPLFGFQLYFEELAPLETAVGRNGPLQALADPAALPSLAAATATQQAMLVRPFTVPEPMPISPTACSYVVHYPGPADDYNAWISHYVHHHPPIMRRFPGLRELEILTRIDWMDALPWQRVHHMQRNRVMFDSAAALTAALHSPVRHEMRADFGLFPAYQGGNFHYPVATEVVRLGNGGRSREAQ